MTFTLNKQEDQYLHLLSDIVVNGNSRDDRTGIGTKGIFGSNIRFSLENNTLPLLTTKKMFTKGVIEELLFFIRGETDTKKLEVKGVNIWKGNTSREFLDKRGLSLPEGDMGKGYGYQWRSWGKTDTNPGIDQLQQVFDGIKNDPYGRRHVVSAWNVSQLDEMSLPPCHILLQLYVNNGELSCQWYQRSVDAFLGLPFNIASYAILTHLFAKATGLKAKELIFSGGDTHIYKNHIDQVRTQISRKPYNFPKLQINKDISSLKDIENLEYSDFEVLDYQCHPAIKADMAV